MSSASELSYSSDATLDCLKDANGDAAQDACIGTAANACMDTADGSTTVGMGYCLSQELSLWDERLNSAFRALMALERADDAEMKEIGAHVPRKVPALRNMQRAWIGFRDAACAYEYSQWGGGTGGGPASTACLLRLTGEQALELELALEARQR